MATPQLAGQLSRNKELSAFDISLVQKTEDALRDGLQLERWTRDPNRKIEEHPLSLNRQYNLKNKAFGYLANPVISGQSLPALGARQEVEFGRITVPNPEQCLKDYVFKHFLETSHWTYDDGDQGGF